MVRFMWLTLTLPFLLNCAASQTRPEVSLLSAPLPTVQVFSSVNGIGGSALRKVASGELIHQNDRILMRVSLKQPAYLYAVWYSPTGESDLLFPKEHLHKLTSPSIQDVLMPGSEQLHGGQTDLRLFVVASAAPMDSALCAALRLRCDPERLVGISRGGDKEKKEDEKKGATRDDRPTHPRPNKPKEDRGGLTNGERPMLSPTPPGIYQAATLIPVILKYEGSK